MRVFLFIFSVFAVNCPVYGQSLNYIQYGTRDGIAGSTVYDLCQDRDGFIWFATNNGVTRFDGKNFKTYTVKEGLPENEVLRLYLDSKGRVWMTFFKNEVCYYENGKIYSKQNNPMLYYDPAFGRVNDLFELPEGTLWFYTSSFLLKYKFGDSIRVEFRDQINPGRVKKSIGAGPPWFQDKLPMVMNDSLFYLSKSGPKFYQPLFYVSGQKILYGMPRTTGDTPCAKLEHDIIRATGKNKGVYFISTIGGAFEVDSVTMKPLMKFLPGKVVTRAIIDSEGEYWFSTLGDGVYKLPNKSVLTFEVYKSPNSENEVFCIAERGNKILTGNYRSKMFEWDSTGGSGSYSFDHLLPLSQNRLSTNRLNVIYALPDGSFLLGFDAFLVHWANGVKGLLPMAAIKTIAFDDADHVLVATGVGLFRVNIKNFRIAETISDQRATVAVRFKNKYFIGTTEGLMVADVLRRKIEAPFSHPALKRRITDLKVYDNSVWVATSDSGILQLSNGKVVKTFSEKDGLSSNICRVLYPHNGSMWIGTNKGICKLDLANPLAFPVKYDSYNLLPNDIINSIFIKNGLIYVGSPAGLTYFHEESLKSASICKLFIEQLKTEQGVFEGGDTIKLRYGANHFEINYTAVSIKSAGEITYYYRLKGLDDSWQTTKAELITYSSIPNGNFRFEIFAVNKFGINSNVRSIVIMVKEPFWKSPFFIIGVGLIIVTMVFFIVKARERYLRSKIDAENKIQQQLAKLEQQALQAQMNPHFIFNCLNSIQQYILVNDSESANRFLSIFARLIRETLENSSFQLISLDREIEFLSKYLELEKMRFGDKFRFEITQGHLLEPELIKIPVMLLQPFVENALRHGIRYRNDNEGLVQIIFEVTDDVLTCRIRDNGVGRKAAGEYKSLMHIEYQSKGMSLTKRRLDILNLTREHRLDLAIHDLFDEKGNAAGTEVLLTLKIFNANDD